MSYRFDSALGGAYVDWGTDARLFLDGDMSVGLWVKWLPSATNDSALLMENGSFPPLIVTFASAAVTGHGGGVNCFHRLGGFFAAGVTCVPELIDVRYNWPANLWMYFGFTRDASTGRYLSYFGTRRAIVSGQTSSYAGSPPIASTVGGQHVGAFLTGLSEFNAGAQGIVIGPFSYWSRALPKADHELLAKCLLPSLSGLLLNCPMGDPLIDTSSFSWTPGVMIRDAENEPRLHYVANNPCVDFGDGQSYGLSSP